MGPLTRTVILIWGSSCRANGNKKDAILQANAGQCANTISVRNGACVVQGTLEGSVYGE